MSVQPDLLRVAFNSLALSVYCAVIAACWIDYLTEAGTTIMAGYKNRFIHLDFPELGDDIWVDILNPLLAPADRLQSGLAVEIGPDGKPVDLSTEKSMDMSYDVAAKLIVRWNVYDIDDVSDDPQPLPVPVTIESMKKLPFSITSRITAELGKAMDQMNGRTSKKS